MEHAVLGAGAIGGLVGHCGGVAWRKRHPTSSIGEAARLSRKRVSGAVRQARLRRRRKSQSHSQNPVDVLWIAPKPIN